MSDPIYWPLLLEIMERVPEEGPPTILSFELDKILVTFHWTETRGKVEANFAELLGEVNELPEPYVMRLRLVMPMELADDPRGDNYWTPNDVVDLIETLLSEMTNNDACETVVRVKSAHFEDMEVPDPEFGSYIIFEAKILDYMS